MHLRLPSLCFLGDTFLNFAEPLCGILFDKPVTYYSCYTPPAFLPHDFAPSGTFFKIEPRPPHVTNCWKYLWTLTRVMHLPHPSLLFVHTKEIFLSLVEIPHGTYYWKGLWNLLILCTFNDPLPPLSFSRNTFLNFVDVLLYYISLGRSVTTYKWHAPPLYLPFTFPLRRTLFKIFWNPSCEILLERPVTTYWYRTPTPKFFPPKKTFLNFADTHHVIYRFSTVTI